MALTLLAPAVSLLLRWSPLLWLPPLAAAWLAAAIVYRLFFHPLAHVPGPRVAACTRLYVFYFDVIAGGSQFYIQIEKLHRQYGMVS